MFARRVRPTAGCSPFFPVMATATMNAAASRGRAIVTHHQHEHPGRSDDPDASGKRGEELRDRHRRFAGLALAVDALPSGHPDRAIMIVFGVTATRNQLCPSRSRVASFREWRHTIRGSDVVADVFASAPRGLTHVQLRRCGRLGGAAQGAQAPARRSAERSTGQDPHSRRGRGRQAGTICMDEGAVRGGILRMGTLNTMLGLKARHASRFWPAER